MQRGSGMSDLQVGFIVLGIFLGVCVAIAGIIALVVLGVKRNVIYANLKDRVLSWSVDGEASQRFVNDSTPKLDDCSHTVKHKV